MNQHELERTLEPLKRDMQERIESRGIVQAIINKHIKMINDCIAQNITVKVIHLNVFPNNDISFNYLKTLIHRARKKLNTGNLRNVDNKNLEPETPQYNNVFSSLKKTEQTPIHNGSSDEQKSNERLERLLKQKRDREN